MLRQPFFFHYLFFLIFSCLFVRCTSEIDSHQLPLSNNESIVLIGNNLCSRMLNFGHFETEMHLRYPSQNLQIRNMCDGGNTPGFRPHSGRFSPWAFPGAERFQTELANFTNSKGHFETPDQWLKRLEADLILAFFGYNESFAGEAGLANFKQEMTAFVEHTLAQEYNGESSSQLVLISPLAFEDLSDKYELPDGKLENKNLALYAEAIRAVAIEYEIPFVDVFQPSQQWFSDDEALTIDGFQLNDTGYQKLAELLADRIFGQPNSSDEANREQVLAAVLEKNWYWHDDYKSPNGVHVFGRRYNPFGPDNYPDEIQKKREMTANRDTAIWYAAAGKTYDLATADAQTHPLKPVATNYKINDYGRGTQRYLYEEEAVSTLTTANGYQVELFASEKEFPDLANPVQIAFDNRGRLWVAVIPTYPHYR
ncbi:MAG: GDSL-type esterase/lipase family protein, partial [Saprospiraceae bacterium]